VDVAVIVGVMVVVDVTVAVGLTKTVFVLVGAGVGVFVGALVAVGRGALGFPTPNCLVVLKPNCLDWILKSGITGVIGLNLTSSSTTTGLVSRSCPHDSPGRGQPVSGSV
jgi:hypothetical protein